ncbi:MAG: zinc ribbon domain-containing protein [Ignavibacteriaceae bacterium]
MYTNNCPNCGEKSDRKVQQCPVCGAAKLEPAAKGSIYKDINDNLVERLSFLDYPQLYVTVITRLVIMLFIIFVIPGFISKSEFFWMVIGIFSVYGLIKEVAKNYPQFRIVYKTSKLLLFAFFGAGFGNLISHTGKLVYFKFSYYFNLEFLYDQLSIGNSMIVLGVVAGIGFMLLMNRFNDEFKVEELDTETD